MHSYCPDIYSEIVMRMDGKLSIGQILLLAMVLNGKIIMVISQDTFSGREQKKK